MTVGPSNAHLADFADNQTLNMFKHLTYSKNIAIQKEIPYILVHMYIHLFVCLLGSCVDSFREII